MPQLLLFPDFPPAEREASLDRTDQAALLSLVLRGGSPQAACQRLGLDAAAFCRTVDTDDDFRRRLRHARELMTHNVVAVVYAAAMKGTPAAQALWLRTFPPADFSELSSDAPSEKTTDEFTSRTDDELQQEIDAYHAARLWPA